jgi:hypothetical protein
LDKWVTKKEQDKRAKWQGETVRSNGKGVRKEAGNREVKGHDRWQGIGHVLEGEGKGRNARQRKRIKQRARQNERSLIRCK